MKKILILGAGAWQTPYLKLAKKMGMKVFATDWSPEAFGRFEADVFEPIDLQNWEASLAFAQKHKVDAVFSSADVGVPTAAYIAEKMSLPGHPLELAIVATNKFRMREKAKSFGLPIPEYEVVKDLTAAQTAADRIGYPVIIKPIDSCASRGVFYIENPKELDAKFQESINASFKKEVLVESFMVGQEGSVEALILNDGTILILGMCSKKKSALPFRFDLRLVYPGNYTESQKKAIEAFIKKLVHGFGIQRGIIHVEIMVSGENIRLIEFGLRGCGSNVITKLMPAITGFDVPKYLLLEAFNEYTPIEIKRHDCGVLRFLMGGMGTITKIVGEENVKKLAGVVDVFISAHPGDKIGVIKNGGGRLGYVMTRADNRQAALDIAEQAADLIKFNGLI